MATVRLIPKPAPYPVPTSAVSAYVSRMETNADYLYDTYYADLGSTNAGYACLNYDAIECYSVLADRISVTNPTLSAKMIAFADKMWAQAKGYSAWTGDAQQPGYYLYNQGLKRLGLDGDAESLEAAMWVAYYGAGSSPGLLDGTHWNYLLTRNTAAASRPAALSVKCHVDVWDQSTLPEWDSGFYYDYIRPDLRDEYVRRVVDEFILNIHLALWLNSPVDNWPLLNDTYRETVGLLPLNWSPFMFAHTARPLIQLLDNGLADTWNFASTIRSDLVDLATMCWDYAWIDNTATTGYKGFLYRPTIEHDETPSADLNMWIFPWFAWVADYTKSTTWYDRCKEIIEGGNDSPTSGFKQFNQQILWAFDGLDRLGWI